MQRQSTGDLRRSLVQQCLLSQVDTTSWLDPSALIKGIGRTGADLLDDAQGRGRSRCCNQTNRTSVRRKGVRESSCRSRLRWDENLRCMEDCPKGRLSPLWHSGFKRHFSLTRRMADKRHCVDCTNLPIQTIPFTQPAEALRHIRRRFWKTGRAYGEQQRMPTSGTAPFEEQPSRLSVP